MIIHLVGTICSGKTWIINQFKDNPKIKTWDILQDFYLPKKIIDENNVFNWELWKKEKEKNQIAKDCVSFIYNAVSNNKIALIESSDNKDLLFLTQSLNANIFYLNNPSIEILKNRIEQRKLNEQFVLQFQEDYIIRTINQQTYSQKEIINIINNLIKDKLNV
jgi:hypothetical protein